MNSTGVEVWRGGVNLWECDQMGHLNVRFYAAHAGVKAEDFVAASKSFAVETKIGQTEKLIRAYRADSTPTFVVAGKYKVEPRNAGSYDEVMKVILYLVNHELAEMGVKK